MKKKNIWIFILFLIIIVGAFCLFFFLKPQDGKENKGNTSPSKDPNFYENNEPNTLDWSAREKEMREQTGNSYYTINNSLQFSRDRKFEMFDMTSIWLIRVGEKTYSFSSQLTNHTKKDTKEMPVVVVFLKEDGSVIAEVKAKIPAISSGGSDMLSFSTSKDVLYAYDFKIKKELKK